MNEEHLDNIRARLLRDHDREAQGTWRILGEDANCDLGGSHYEPELEVVSGTYRNVVNYALTLPRFFTWGSGGRITKLEIPTGIANVDQMRNPRVLLLEEERNNLRNRLKEIDAEIASIVRK